MIFYLIDQFILGQFKWTLTGMTLTLAALLVSRIIGRWVKPTWARALIAVVLVGLFVWYGHELIDPLLHGLEAWWITPLGEPMRLDMP